MKRADSFRDAVCEALEGLPRFACRSMFGGYGLYSAGRFFGLIYRGRLYFKVDQATKGRYEAAGASFFKPNARQSLKSCYEVPPEVLEEPRRLLDWARDAVRAAGA